MLLHDASLEAGRRFAEAYGGEALPIEGDRIRFARAVFARRPAFVVGVSRPADALLIEDVGREAGYVLADDKTVREMTAAAQPLDRGLVLGWVLAPDPDPTLPSSPRKRGSRQLRGAQGGYDGSPPSRG